MAVQLGYTKIYRDPLGYPAWKVKGFPVDSAPAGLSGGAAEPSRPRPIHGWAMLWTLFGIFAGGIALNLTPCVYPLIPITVSYFVGRSGKGLAGLITHGICYIGGLSVTNSTLGVAAAMTGGLMGALLQNPVVHASVAAILVFFAMSLFGLWELRLPSGVTQAASKSYAGYFGSLFMGLTLGVVAAPCIGPFILGLLTWVAGMGSPLLGFLVFFTLSLGLGLPLFTLAVFSGQIDRLPRSGNWMLWVRKLMGWVLVGMAAYFVRPVLPKTAGVFLLAGVAVAAAVHLGWMVKTEAGMRTIDWLKGAVAAAGLVMATLLVGEWALRGPGVSWQPYAEEVLIKAQQLHKPVMIDFYAEWCAPCRQLDEITFHDPQVVKGAADDFIAVKVDLTRRGNPAHEALLKRYGIKGVPTVVFLDRDGNEREELRIVDFLSPDQFLVYMAEAYKEQSP